MDRAGHYPSMPPGELCKQTEGVCACRRHTLRIYKVQADFRKSSRVLPESFGRRKIPAVRIFPPSRTPRQRLDEVAPDGRLLINVTTEHASNSPPCSSGPGSHPRSKPKGNLAARTGTFNRTPLDRNPRHDSNFSAENGEDTDKGSRLFRRLRCERVALRAAGSPRSLRKSAVIDQPFSFQLKTGNF
jgi:hypothetical protein